MCRHPSASRLTRTRASVRLASCFLQLCIAGLPLCCGTLLICVIGGYCAGREVQGGMCAAAVLPRVLGGRGRGLRCRLPLRSWHLSAAAQRGRALLNPWLLPKPLLSNAGAAQRGVANIKFPGGKLLASDEIFGAIVRSMPYLCAVVKASVPAVLLGSSLPSVYLANIEKMSRKPSVRVFCNDVLLAMHTPESSAAWQLSTAERTTHCAHAAPKTLLWSINCTIMRWRALGAERCRWCKRLWPALEVDTL